MLVAIEGNAAFLFQNLEPAVTGQAEFLCHTLDFSVDIGLTDMDATSLRLVKNELSIDHGFERIHAISRQTLLGELLAIDGLAIDNGKYGNLVGLIAIPNTLRVRTDTCRGNLGRRFDRETCIHD